MKALPLPARGPGSAPLPWGWGTPPLQGLGLPSQAVESMKWGKSQRQREPPALLLGPELFSPRTQTCPWSPVCVLSSNQAYLLTIPLGCHINPHL